MSLNLIGFAILMAKQGGVRIHYQSNCKYIGSVYIVTVSNLVRSNAPKNLSTYEDHILAANRLFTWYLQPQHDNETKPLHHEDIHSLENSIFDEVYSSFNKSISVNETTINFPNTLDGFAPLLSIFGGSFKLWMRHLVRQHQNQVLSGKIFF